ncbi:flagellar basal-body MS-ring/collar protein FliF [Variovorax ginsengisoli]|uniref:Flagellar M-ring protein n=1 Tax=Variovorax ginsengisoli TaxID=363844 RepID=A0ABT9SDN7_9BURK|nr:flagellar basal-body MS-ring/collar protein FliF [Variovorax ginsengisoli]MDP9902300.1 flagellar M-ring protein FliF [Variovorax ginsengisoli]
MSTAATADALHVEAPANAMLAKLRAQPKLPMIIGAATLVAAAAAFMLWNRGPEYKVLYSNVAERDGGAIIASLQQMNVPYKFSEGGGAILVAGDKVPELRLKLAAQGLPKGAGVGFELMDNQKFGTSQFAEQVNYQRALEGELARSVESIGTVESARVHLALPKPSLFVREQKKPSASVVVTLYRGRSIDEGQVSAIVHMLSSSVPDLDPKSVTVIDQRGNLLSAANSATRGLDLGQVKYTQEVEQTYIRRIEAILQPMLGTANVRAQVVADIDFSVVENTEEKYRPNQTPGAAAVRSQLSSESAQLGATPPGGVPGALSNQPPANPTAPITTAAKPGAPNTLTTAPQAAAAPSGPSNTRKDVTTNYEVDRTIRHSQQGAGGVRRLSVAVVVNHVGTADNTGKPTQRELTPVEIEQITNLTKEAMGFSKERGDSLNVVNSLFAKEPAEEAAAPVVYWKDPQNIAMARSALPYLLLTLFALFAWFAVLRPLLRKHLAPPPATAAGEILETSTPPTAEELAAVTAAEAAAMQQRAAERQQSDLDYAHQVADKDPRLVAMMIDNWMTRDE